MTLFQKAGKAAVLTFFGLVLFTLPLYADQVRTGTAYIPGQCNPKRQLKYSVRMSKTPYGNAVNSDQMHVWIDLELCNPQPGDNISFVMCAMININKPNISLPAYNANIANGTWTCVSTGGTQAWKPNYHLGCRRVTLTGTAPKKNVVDQRITLSQSFTEAEIAAPYIDLAVDCPNGFQGCDAIKNSQDIWLVPGDGAFPNGPNGCNGTSSWWSIASGCTYNASTGNLYGTAVIPTGNWYTMRWMELEYPAIFTGIVENVPVGSEIEVRFPETAGAETQVIIADATRVGLEIPFVMTHELMELVDDHTYFTVRYPAGTSLPDPSRTISFQGEVVATEDSFFPDTGEPMFYAGGTMHFLDVQFAMEMDPPFVADQSLGPTPDGLFDLRVAAADPSTMAIAASVMYEVDGKEVFQGLDYDQPAAGDGVTFFRATLETFPESYTIYVSDDAGNLGQLTVDGGVAESSTRMLPHVTRPGGGFETGILIANTGTQPQIYRLTGYTETGSTATAGVVPPNTTLSLGVEELFGRADISHIRIDDTGEVKISASYRSVKEGSGPVHVNEASDLSTSWRLFLGDPKVTWDGFAAVNAGAGPALLTVVHKDFNDKVLGLETLEVEPNKKQLGVLSTMFDTQPGTYVELTANQPLCVMALRGNLESSFLWQNLALSLDP